jgi:hypothetical protein
MMELLFQLLARDLRTETGSRLDPALGGGTDEDAVGAAPFDAVLAATLAGPAAPARSVGADRATPTRDATTDPLVALPSLDATPDPLVAFPIRDATPDPLAAFPIRDATPDPLAALRPTPARDTASDPLVASRATPSLDAASNRLAALPATDALRAAPAPSDAPAQPPTSVGLAPVAAPASGATAPSPERPGTPPREVQSAASERTAAPVNEATGGQRAAPAAPAGLLAQAQATSGPRPAPLLRRDAPLRAPVAGAPAEDPLLTAVEPERPVARDPGDVRPPESETRAASERRGGRELPSFAQTSGKLAARATSPPTPFAEPAASTPKPVDAGLERPGLETAAAAAADVPEPAAEPAALAADRGVARAASRAAPAPPAHTPPSEAVAERVQWLAERGGGTVRVQLHPASLGEIELAVRLRGGVASVAIRTRESATRGLLAGERAALTHILAARDVRIDDFAVVHEPAPRAETPADAGGERTPRDGFAEARERGGDEARQPRGFAAPGGGRDAATPSAPAPGPFAPTTHQETRLDLRI